MAKFAKLFDLENGEQMLVTCRTNDDGDWRLTFSTEIDGLGTVDMALAFKAKNGESAESAARKAFDLIDEDSAKGAAASIQQMVSDDDDDHDSEMKNG